MASTFDLMSVMLFIASAGLFLIRARHEPQQLMPYLIVALVCVVGAWLGNNGGGIAAVAFLIAGAFLTLHTASQPYAENAEDSQ